MAPESPTDERPGTGSRWTRTRWRSRLPWLVAAVVLVLIAAAAAYAVLRDSRPAWMPTVDREPRVATVSLPAGGAAPRCAMPTPEILRGADLAVDATVADVTGATATLVPSRVYTGGPADNVRVDRASPSRVSLILGVRFEQGERYLVAADGGTVLVCGLSGAYDDDLADLYEEAFDPPE